MSIIDQYKQDLENVRFVKETIKAQLAALREKINTNSPNDKNWQVWWQEKSDLTNNLADILGMEQTLEQKIASLE